MNIAEILTVSGITTLLLAFVALVTKSIYQEALATEFKKQLEDYKEMLKWENAKKEKATAVAKVVTLAIVDEYDPNFDNNRHLLELQQEYWQLALWLDTETLRKLDKLLSKETPIEFALKETLVAVRKLIQGKEDDYSSDEMLHFRPRGEFAFRPRKEDGNS